MRVDTLLEEDGCTLSGKDHERGSAEEGREGKDEEEGRDTEGTFGRLYSCIFAKEGRAMVDYGAQWRIAIASLSLALFWLV